MLHQDLSSENPILEYSFLVQVSRSFGDAQFEGSGCSAVPAVTAFTVGPREVFLLAGCDGFWSVKDPQGAVDFVQAQLAQGRDPKAATNRYLGHSSSELHT